LLEAARTGPGFGALEWCWYKSGTIFFGGRYKARFTRAVALGVPIHHRGDGEAAGRLGVG